MRTRFAPTPSGFLHEGNLYNFLLTWLWARSNKGSVLLRIDDGDAERKRKEYVEDIFRVLEWLELDWDTGPSGPDDFEKNWSQHSRTALYHDLLHQLVQKNKVFACTCSRRESNACSCIEKNVPLHTKEAAWRLRNDANDHLSIEDHARGLQTLISHETGPFIIRKKDGFASYQLCSLADDLHFGISHICRGEDLLPSTFMQLAIDRMLDAPGFYQCRFWHHALISGADGQKLSKSAGHQSQSLLTTLNKESIFLSFCRWMELPPAISARDLLNYPFPQ